jgi:protein arginine kinase activator
MSALLRKIHGSNEHVGITEDESIGPVDEREAKLLEMRRDLRQAVDNEEYELAAELRDRISALEEDRRAARAAAFETEEGL